MGGTLHDAARIAHQNVQKAIAKFHELKTLGYLPYVPHLSHYLHIEGPEDYEGFWLEFDFTILDHWAEAIYMMKGWQYSYGAQKEHAYALAAGLKIIYEED